MDLFQSGAIIMLLTLVIYFVMINIFKGPALLKTTGLMGLKEKDIQELDKRTEEEENPSLDEIENGIRKELGISNKLPIEGLKNESDTGSELNLTGKSVFNPDTKGIVPSNHDLFEKKADFGSDVTNINQFYQNNPDVFNKTMARVSDVTGWNNKGNDMYQKILNSNNMVHPSNFEHNFTKI